MPRRWCHRWGLYKVSRSIRTSLDIEDIVYIPVKFTSGVDVKDYVEVYDYELEALALIHVHGLRMDEAASRMGLSKATFWRIVEQCRFKIAKALLERKPLKLVSTKHRSQIDENLLSVKQVSNSGENI